ncbi:MAG: hypothetical protein AAGA91_07635 [Pseudomonadota bacterium]
MFKGFAQSTAFAIACHAKVDLAQSMARVLGPQGIHVAQRTIDFPDIVELPGYKAMNGVQRCQPKRVRVYARTSQLA